VSFINKEVTWIMNYVLLQKSVDTHAHI
jgi:hypothetical protein